MSTALSRSSLLFASGVNTLGTVNTLPFIVEQDSGDILFKRGEGNLRCGPRGRTDWNGKRGPWARWTAIEDGENPGTFFYSNVGHASHGETVYLAEAGGELVVSRTPTVLQFVAATEERVAAQAAQAAQAASAVLPPVYTLTTAERADFINDGYVRLRSLVQPELLNEALRTINMDLNPASGAWSKGEDGELVAPSRGHPSIRALLYSSALYGVLEQLLGVGLVTRPQMAQLALRFPNNKPDQRPDDWHIDGMPTWHKCPFQLLVGVALSSQPRDDCGNLAIFPGWHGALHEAVRRVRAEHPIGAPDDGTMWHGTKPKLPAGSAQQVHLEPGDVIIAHQKLPHRVSPNRSPHIRYMVYFRISSVQHRPMHLGELWTHFDGLHELAAPAMCEPEQLHVGVDGGADSESMVDEMAEGVYVAVD